MQSLCGQEKQYCWDKEGLEIIWDSVIELGVSFLQKKKIYIGRNP